MRSLVSWSGDFQPLQVTAGSSSWTCQCLAFPSLRHSSREGIFIFYWVHTRFAPPQCVPFFQGAGSFLPAGAMGHSPKGTPKGLETLSGLILPDPTDGLKPPEETPQRRRGHQSGPGRQHPTLLLPAS